MVRTRRHATNRVASARARAHRRAARRLSSRANAVLPPRRYYSPFPKEYDTCDTLYFCEFDLHFVKKPEALPPLLWPPTWPKHAATVSRESGSVLRVAPWTRL